MTTSWVRPESARSRTAPRTLGCAEINRVCLRKLHRPLGDWRGPRDEAPHPPGTNENPGRHGSWSLYHQEGPLDLAVVEQLQDWHGDGIMFLAEGRELVQAIHRLGLPSLNLVEAIGNDEAVWMARHDQLIAQQAAEHLLQRGFENFAYCGFQGVAWSERRGEAFAAHLAKKGLPSSLFMNLVPTRGSRATVSLR